MQILEITQESKKDISAVLAYAAGHRMPLSDVILIANNEKKSPAGFDPGYVCHLNHGYRVVFSIEEHPGGWCKHISISLNNVECPSPDSVEEILKEFGLSPLKTSLNVWVEEGWSPTGSPIKAVNIIQQEKL